LPYHRLGETKYERLEKPSATFSAEPPSEARMAELQQMFASCGLTAVIGG
jgi:hypothetical protein